MFLQKKSDKEFKLEQLRKQLEMYAMAKRAYPFNEKYQRGYSNIQKRIAKLEAE